MRSSFKLRRKIPALLIAFLIVVSGCASAPTTGSVLVEPYSNCVLDVRNPAGPSATCNKTGESKDNYEATLLQLDGFSCLSPADMQQLLNELVLCRGAQ